MLRISILRIPFWLLCLCLPNMLSHGRGGGRTFLVGNGITASSFHKLPEQAYRFSGAAPAGQSSRYGADNPKVQGTPFLMIGLPDAVGQKMLFTVTVCLIAALIAYFLVRMRTHQLTLRKYEHAKQERRLAELELEAVKAHINPHFIYNCLNSIQYFNYEQQHELSGRYLDLFAKLIRFTIQYSQQAFISVKEEATYLDNYLQMEKMRFMERLRYRIEIAENVDAQRMIPAMLIQPYVENALKHGIAPRKEGGHITVRITQPEKEILEVTVEDDGAGFAPAPVNEKHSLGLRLSGSRARTYNQLFGTDIRIHIQNKKDLDPVRKRHHHTNQNTCYNMSTQAYTCFIIDDDEHSKQLTRRHLASSFPEIRITGQAGTVADAVSLLSETVPDIIFLDVELPDGTGFDILRQYVSLHAQIILITAFDHYALKAIKASVIDYVLKPVNEHEFGIAVHKAIARCRDNDKPQNDFSELLTRFHNQMVIRKIKLPTLHGFIFADIDDITRCEATDNYTVLYFSKQTPRTVSRTLGTYEEELRSYGFIRIHHKHLINIMQVAEYNKGKSGGGYVVMKDKAVLQVSVRKKDQLLYAFHSRKHTL